jgi:hypothetical protein
MEFNKGYLIKLANTRMPFGKYQNRLLVELPEPYLVWFKQKGFPGGQLGQMLQEMLEIKMNGLEYLIQPLIGGK